MKQVHLIGNAHLDPVWLWKKPEGLSEIKSTFRSALDRMKEFPDYVFTSACAGYYYWIEQIDPAMFDEIRKRVKEGRWSIAGGFWIQPDCNLPSGEAFARHVLYSQNYFREKFGVTARVGYNVDSFGHNGMLPQILKKSGMDAYVSMRPDETVNSKIPGHLFRWEAPDGSRVTAFKIYLHYGDGGTETCVEHAQQFKEKALSDGYPYLCFYGVGNHGGGPTVRSLNALSQTCKEDESIAFSSVNRYFEEVENLGLTEKLPVVSTDLQHHASGCYSAHAPVKAANRRAERALIAAEVYDALANSLLNVPSQHERFRPAWEKVMFNQFHDILAGCSIREAYEDALNAFSAACDTAQEVTSLATQRISWNIKTTRILDASPCQKNGWILWEKDGEGAPVVLFNPHSFPITVPVQVNINISGATDSQGIPVPLQRVRGPQTNGGDLYNTIFMADIPAWGYATYYIFKDQSFPLPESGVSADKYLLENEWLKVSFDPDTGAISSLWDKENEKELSAGGMANALVIDDHRADTWAHRIFTFDDVIGRFSDPVFRVTDNGPLRASLRVTTHYGTSSLVQDFILHKGKKELEVRCRLDYHEKLKIVKLSFPTAFSGGKATYSMPYGFLDKEPDGAEEPSHEWMGVSDGESGEGLALLNDSKYSFSVKNGEMRMIAARSSIFADHFGQRDDLVEYQDQGEQFFRYVLKPFRRSDPAGVVKAAAVLNQQPALILETHHDGPLDTQYAGIRISAENVIAQTIKLPEREGQEKKLDGHVIRLYETAGKSTETDIELPLLNRIFHISMKPQEIKTLFLPRDGGDAVETDLTEH